ncbi:MAG: T9SS type A sorting domain-containing protein [Ignavibacteriales bacterium]|nr:T9SS type A sorting domain-containing protein [Ignavibacteriales bacterium]
MKLKSIDIELRRAGIFILLAFLTISNLSLAQNTRVDWYSFNMGFTESNSVNSLVKSVVGQNFIGTTQLSNTMVIGGFLADTMFRALVVAVSDQPELPASFSLAQNYPNPFNPSTTIHFELPKETNVSLKIFNMLGQEVLSVLDETRAAGKYDVRIDASQLASGVYFYQLRANNFVETKKLMLMK